MSGDLAVWTFNNQQRLGTYWLTLLSGQHGDPDTAWQVVGAADMDGDGQRDLVWWNQQTAALRLWHMNGLTQLDSVDLPFTAGDTNWQIAGLADFDGDGYPDLIWRDYSTGGLAMWQMRDTERVQTLWLSPDSDSDLNWRIVGVADLNADGHPDLVWQDTATGQLAVWWMGGVDGITSTGSAYLTPSSVSDLNWRIVGAR